MKPLNPALNEALKFLETIDPTPTHPRQVCFLAGQLFLQCESIHHLGQEDLFLLETACLLHDIGWARSATGTAHHKQSAAMIREHSWKILDPAQVDLVAQIARYHRKALPKFTHKPFRNLKPSMRSKLLSLAALIRVADALDRSHRSVIRSLECEISKGSCRLHLQTGQEILEEISAVESKRDLFELHFSTRLETILLTGSKISPSSTKVKS